MNTTGTIGDVPPLYVSTSSYDDMGAILDRLGLPYENLETVDLADRSDGVVMLNCSFSWDDEVDLSKLQTFVENGGALIASDLTYKAVASISDARFEGHDWGDAVDAEVVDPELADLLGRERLELDFDTALKKVRSMPSDGEPVLRTVDGGHVIAYRSSVGRGSVLYTSFHNHSQSSEIETALLQVLMMVPIADSTGTTVRDAYTTVVYGGSEESADPDATVIKDVKSDESSTAVFDGDESTTVVLSVVDGGSGELRRKLSGGETSQVGREDFAGLVDDDRRQYISGTHLILRSTDDGTHGTVEVEDANSTNGTALNGSDISDGGFHTVTQGEEIELAKEVRVEVQVE